jgi:hypothetical protein
MPTREQMEDGTGFDEATSTALCRWLSTPAGLHQGVATAAGSTPDLFRRLLQRPQQD